MKNTKTVIISIWLIVFCIVFNSCGKKNEFESWNENCESLKVLTSYMKNVTDKKSSDFIPIEDRIAVFDLDGTLFCEKFPIYYEWLMFNHRVFEDSNYNPTNFEKSVAEEIALAARTKKIPGNLEKDHAIASASAFAGMSVSDYVKYTKNYMQTQAEGFERMKRGEAFYKPMLEVVNYLQKNDFTVYICSGTDRILARALIEGTINIPARQVIGMDSLIVSNNQNKKDGLEYIYGHEDYPIRSAKLIIKNVQMNKVSQIVQEIGQKPVLSFGNSSGDISMARFVTSNNKHKSAAFMVVNDDSEREYGDIEKAEKLFQTWKKNGWTSFSMKNDFKTIYGDGVSKLK